MYLIRELSIFPILFLCFLWGFGGWLIVRKCFRLEDGEGGLSGFILGMILSTWLFNLLGRWLPLDTAAWSSAAILVIIGVLINYRDFPILVRRSKPRFEIWLSLIALTFFFTLIGRGLAIFDDNQNLPILSVLASGDIPPGFPLQRGISLGYHYFILLIGAQFVHVGQTTPWTALDLTRSITLASTILLLGAYVYRLARSSIARILGMIFGTFAGGTRWLLLLFPPSITQKISDEVVLIGSGADSGVDLLAALAAIWNIDGDGPVPFPFAYTSGVFKPLVLALSGVGAAPIMIVILLLMLGDRINSRMSWVPLSILLASFAMVSEPFFGMVCAGGVIVILLHVIKSRSLTVPGPYVWWLPAIVIAGILAMVQGGMFTEVARGLLLGGQETSYFEVQFQAIWPPMVISSHLGFLSLDNPYQLIAAFLEIGPILFLLPLLVIHTRETFQQGRWMEGSILVAGYLSLAMIFVRYSGNAGPTATTRLYLLFIDLCIIFTIPLLWRFLSDGPQVVQGLLILFLAIQVFSGTVILSTQIHAAGKPVASYFLTPLDEIMFDRYFDELEPDAMVFDSNPFRAVTLFGRAVDSSPSFTEIDREYLLLAEETVPSALRRAGYAYIYADKRDWEQHEPTLQTGCVELVDEVVDLAGETNLITDFRRLLDIRECSED